MYNDPTVEEIHRYRNEYARQFNYDIKAICRNIREKEKQSGKKLFSFSPRPVHLQSKSSQLIKTASRG